jgi:hypothetical protein
MSDRAGIFGDGDFDVFAFTPKPKKPAAETTTARF